MTRVAVTGAGGFVGWHLRCRARAAGGPDVVPLGRADLADADALAARLAGVDAVVHLAGVNRGRPEEVEKGNIALAETLETALSRCGGAPRVVYADSIHARSDTPYGRAKRAAGEILAGWAERSGGGYCDVVLPNLFGEHGRPFYNSFVATFCHQLAHGETPTVVEDRPVELLHVQDAVEALLRAVTDDARWVAPAGRTHRVGEVLRRLEEFARVYHDGRIPPLASRFDVRLFNTYRSFLFPGAYPIRPVRHADARGHLIEAVKQDGGPGQVFYSVTRPGATRGDHFHLRKIERFLVMSGTAEIALRRLGTEEVVRFTVSGETPAIVDMPALWAHSITNTGASDLVTLFWCNEVFDPADPDTHPEPVEVTAP